MAAWNTPEFDAEVEAMVADMKQTAGLCSAPYFHNQYGWNSGVDEVGNDGGFYWLASGLVARW